ncbi:MAG: tetratricopeptide repeat protein [Candidatus Acidiferrales bacterium]
MRRLPELVLAFPFLVVSAILAQQPSGPPSATPVATSAPQVASTSPTLTPRELAEVRGDVQMARKMYREAISTYVQLAIQEPHNAILLNKIGVAYQQEGDSGHAGRYYKQAIKADKTYVSALNNLGTVEYEKKHYGKSIHLYKQTLQFRADTPTVATVYSNLGYAYFADKQYAAAMDSFEKALRLNPQVFDRHAGFGSIVQQRAVEDPGLFYFLVAKSYAKAGDIEHCAHFLRMARDEGYKEFRSAQTDPSFVRVIKDPQIQEILQVPPPYAGTTRPQGL